jgi:hypothetical protein
MEQYFIISGFCLVEICEPIPGISHVSTTLHFYSQWSFQWENPCQSHTWVSKLCSHIMLSEPLCMCSITSVNWINFHITFWLSYGFINSCLKHAWCCFCSWVFVHVDVGNISDVSEVHFSSAFRVDSSECWNDLVSASVQKGWIWVLFPQVF